MKRFRRLRCAWRGFHWWTREDGAHSMYHFPDAVRPAQLQEGPRWCMECGYHDWWAWGIPWTPLEIMQRVREVR